MIIGIGIDLIELDSWRRFLSQYFTDFCSECFSGGEISQINRSDDPVLCAALYFSIKEAVLKAIGIGLKEGVAWVDIEVLTLSPKPQIVVRRACQQYSLEFGIDKFLVETVTVPDKTVLASVIALGRA
jgi:holo-[acyl-carrier protein] synthase